MNKDLMNAILAMDAYNRGYDPKINDGSVIGNEIGNAVIDSDSEDLGSNEDGKRVDQSSSFYAISYTYGGETIISYRGTDKLLNDAITGWTLGVGIYNSDQAMLAARFYQMVLTNDSDPDNNIFDNDISFTGHSLGGGLAAFMASIYSKEALVFNHMPYELAADYLEVVTNDPDSVLYDPAAAYLYYGSQPTREINNSDVTAYATSGELLYTVRETAEANRLLTEIANPLYENPLDYTTVDYLNPGEFEGSYDLHSQALLVTLLYAKTEKEVGNLTEEWHNVAGSFIDALFDDDVAHSISSSLSADQMLNKIAYSAIDEGTRVFGDTAIRALFNDANDLGKAVGVSNVSSIIDSLIDYDIQSAVSKMLVQFAGKLAEDKVLYSNNSQAIEGMLKLSSNSDALTIKLSSTIWGTSSPFEKSQMLNSLYNKFGITDASIMPSASDVENVVLSTTNNGSNYDGDLLENINGTNLLFGADGIDNISGSISKDIIFGGKGDDTLEGGAGSDTYIFNDTYNKDTITDSDNNGKIIINNQTVIGTATLINAENPNLYQLAIGVNVYSLTVSGSDLVIVNQGDPENEGTVQNQITIKNFSSGNLGITLADVPDEGTVVYQTYYGTSGDDAIGKYSGNNIIYAGSGNDTISARGGIGIVYGGSGNDSIHGGGIDITINAGTGIDYMESTSNATYIFNQGDGNDRINKSQGNDKIIFGEGIAKDDVSFIYKNNGLAIKYSNDGSDQVTIDGFFYDYNRMDYLVENVEFSDGSVMNLASGDFTLEIYGTDGDDNLGNSYLADNNVIYAGSGNDTITLVYSNNIVNSGAGDDLSYSNNAGNDTYIFNKGDGKDTIWDFRGTDKIKFGEGITKDDIYFTPSQLIGYPDTLTINFRNNSTDQISIGSYFDSSGYYADAHKIETLEFSDGSIVNLSDLHPENTTILFNKGDGSYVVNDSFGNANKIIFGEGITRDEIYLTKAPGVGNEGKDLIINFTNSSSDKITFTEYFYNFIFDSYQISTFEFSDGSIVNMIDLPINIEGTSGDDSIWIAGENDYLINGGDGNDGIFSGGDDNNITANMGNGDDMISVGGGNNNLYGDAGNDNITVSDSTNTNMVDGGEGDDRIETSQGNDAIYGGSGNDLIYSNGGNDVVDGGDGVDDIYASDGNDTINGGSGNDTIHSESGNDVINGNDGDDLIYGGSGSNTLSGGAGLDKFIIQSESQTDTITDFDLANDKIDVSELYLNKYFSELNVYQDGTDAVIEISDKKIILKNIDSTSLSASNFYGVLKDGGYAVNGTKNDDIFDDNYSAEEAMENDSYVINGYAGNDTIKDSYGAKDILDGGEGNDTLIARYNGATLIGGDGSDQFIFSYFQSYYYEAVTNIISDFDINDPSEKIILDSTAIGDFSELVIVDQNNSELSFDSAKNDNSLKVSVVDSDEGAVVTYTSYSYWGYYSFTNTIIIKGITADQLNASHFQIGTTINGSSYDETFDYSDATNNYYISGYGGNDTVITGSGDDYIYVEYGDDVVNSGSGNDEIYAYGGNDIIHAGDGEDYIESQYGSTDELVQIYAEAGNDEIYISDSAKHEVHAGEGNDTINSRVSLSSIDADNGNDTINLLYGENNQVNTGSGNDIINIYGDSFNNTISGGDGDDVFAIRKSAYGNVTNNNNYITDFDINNLNEKIDLQFLNIEKFEDLSIYQEGDYAYVYYSLGEGLGSGSIMLENIDAAQLTAENFLFKNNGTENNDTINANNKFNVINSGAGNDEISISGLDNYISGGLGNDVFTVNKIANSQTTISDFETTNINEKIIINNFSEISSFNDLYIKYTKNYETQQYTASINLGDGQTLTIDNINKDSLSAENFEFIQNINTAPIAVDDSVVINEDSSITITFASILANDSDAEDGDLVNNISGDNIIFTNPSNGTIIKNSDSITYIPNSNYNGTDSISYQIKDSNGVLSNAASINLNITLVNDAPVINVTIPSQLGKAGNTFTYTIPSDSFTDIDNDINSLTYSAKQSNGSDLPAWLTFDNSSKTFSGTPASGIATTLSILVTASDGFLSATQTFSINIDTNAINGNSENNSLTGTSDNDEIYGKAGNDIITGGLGSDIINGGAGIDIASYVDSNVGVTVNLLTNVNEGGTAAGDILTNIENIIGSSYKDDITGNNSANIISAGDDNDHIMGGLGADIINGGNGIDTVSYKDSTKAVTVNLTTNTNKNGTAAGDKLSNIENITGSSFNDNITGDANNNVLKGANGNDILNGGTGNDQLIGGSGKDTMTGGSGNDTFTFTSLSDSSINSSDLIKDFTKGQDQIDFSDLGFSSIVKGASSASEEILHYYYSNNNTVIEDHDLTFKVTLTGKIALDNGDFDF